MLVSFQGLPVSILFAFYDIVVFNEQCGPLEWLKRLNAELNGNAIF